MKYQKKQLLTPLFAGVLSTIMIAGTSPALSNAKQNRNEGTSLGIGAGVKLLNLKNIATKDPSTPAIVRSHDALANASSPVLGVYARQYMPNLIFVPTFLGFEFNYLTDMKKKSIYAQLSPATSGGLDTGYQYRERWDSRLMLGAQLFCLGALDFWAQAGIQLTYFDYEGRTREDVNGITQIFKMDNNLALAPTGGLEVRFTNPNLFSGCATDFIVGWTAGYRNAFRVQGFTSSPAAYDIAMSSNWSHTFGLKVMFRF